jgi:3-hydroxyisobutyrate dehydrogenase
MASLGWIGLGRIGTGMALLLRKAGRDLHVYDVRPEQMTSLVEAGAHAAESPADVAARCEAVFLSAIDTDSVAAIVFGPNGIAAGGGAGKLVIDHTTIHPERTREIAARLRSQTGMGWVDAPVSGTPGTLSVFAGGDAADVARARWWLTAYAANITHVGPLGAGQIAKSCNQAVVTATLAIWSEVLGYAQRRGLDPATLMQAIGGGGADSAVRKYFERELLAGQLPPETVRNMTKDLQIVRDMAGAEPMPMNATVAAVFARAFGTAA